MSYFHNSIPTKDRAKALEGRLRVQGYADGWALRPAKCLDLTYQRAWRDGREARQREDAS